MLRTGVAMLLSALYVRFRDVQPIWEVIQQILFYASPILYTVQTTAITKCSSPRSRTSSCSTRSAAIITQFRHALISRAPAQRRGSARRLGCAWLIPLAIVVAMFVDRLHGTSTARPPPDRGEAVRWSPPPPT